MPFVSGVDPIGQHLGVDEIAAFDQGQVLITELDAFGDDIFEGLSQIFER